MKVLQTIAGFGALYGGIATCTYDLILAMYNIGFPIDLLTLEVISGPLKSGQININQTIPEKGKN